MNVVGIRSKNSRVILSPAVISMALILAFVVSSHTWAGEPAKTDVYPGHLVLLPGERIVLGTVEAIGSQSF